MNVKSWTVRSWIISLTTLMVFSGALPLTTHAAEAPLPKPGDTAVKVAQQLGAPESKVAVGETGSHWLYPLRDGKKIELHLDREKLDSIRVSLQPALPAEKVIPKNLLLFEVTMTDKEDSQAGERSLAHPESGRIWTLDPSGNVLSWSIRPAWKAKKPGKKLSTFLKPKSKVKAKR